MFTKSDIVDFAGQVLRLEEKMKADYTALAADIADPELSAIFAQLAVEEQQHADSVTRLLALLSE